MVRSLILWFLALALFASSSCGPPSIHGRFVNAGERNYDLKDGSTVVCSNVAPSDSCDFTMTLGNHVLTAEPTGYSKQDIHKPSNDYLAHFAVLTLNVQDHDYTFKVRTEHHDAVFPPAGLGLSVIPARDNTDLEIATSGSDSAVTTPAPETTQPSTVTDHFDTEEEASAACADDTVVWVNSNSGVFHFRGQRWYGNTAEGYYECERGALAEGDRPTRNGQ